ncbi:unnamed protein product [Malus baccata var. baccata]
MGLGPSWSLHGSAYDDMQERPITRYQVVARPVQGRRLEQCLVSVLQIGLSCFAISPSNRMLMDVVVNKMKATRESLV